MAEGVDYSSVLAMWQELEVMNVKAAMLTAINGKPGIRDVKFSTKPLLYQFKTRRPRGEPVTIKPDGFIRVQEDDTDGLFEHTFYLEVD